MALTQRVGVESPSRALYPSMQAQGPPDFRNCNKLSKWTPVKDGKISAIRFAISSIAYIRNLMYRLQGGWQNLPTTASA